MQSVSFGGLGTRRARISPLDRSGMKVVAAHSLEVPGLLPPCECWQQGVMPEDKGGCLRAEVVVGNPALLPKGQLAAQAFTSWTGSRSWTLLAFPVLYPVASKNKGVLKLRVRIDFFSSIVFLHFFSSSRVKQQEFSCWEGCI